jgi:hypothetical protein
MKLLCSFKRGTVTPATTTTTTTITTNYNNSVIFITNVIEQQPKGQLRGTYLLTYLLHGAESFLSS